MESMKVRSGIVNGYSDDNAIPRWLSITSFLDKLLGLAVDFVWGANVSQRSCKDALPDPPIEIMEWSDVVGGGTRCYSYMQPRRTNLSKE